MIEGRVIKSTGSWYNVHTEEHGVVPCRTKGKLRINSLKVTNPIAVGDIVNITIEEEEELVGTIEKILPRTNYVIRQSPRKKHFLHLLASNVDQAILIVTVVEPMLKVGFIDRFLMMTEPYRIPVTIVFNKTDLYNEEDDTICEHLSYIYENIGYNVVRTSSESGEGVEELRTILKDKYSLIAGQSGVGKSTLVNTLQPGLELRTADISEYSGKGQHTTTFAEMFFLENGGAIIDTPGIKTLSFSHLEEEDVIHNFRDIFGYSQYCKFNDCSHRNEPKCAVKAAVENHEIAEIRYENYLQILSEIEDQNYWERHDF